MLSVHSKYSINASWYCFCSYYVIIEYRSLTFPGHWDSKPSVTQGLLFSGRPCHLTFRVEGGNDGPLVALVKGLGATMEIGVQCVAGVRGQMG